jgi:hypothetical protein
MKKKRNRKSHENETENNDTKENEKEGARRRNREEMRQLERRLRRKNNKNIFLKNFGYCNFCLNHQTTKRTSSRPGRKRSCVSNTNCL